VAGLSRHEEVGSGPYLRFKLLQPSELLSAAAVVAPAAAP
jgi:hypothetical protein